MKTTNHSAVPASDREPLPGTCRSCDGTGKMKVTVLRECSICDGTGTVLGRPCAKCHGSRPVSYAEELQTCSKCLGTALPP
ncbi:MAG: hypothetical protein HGB04_05150 [Chlorobiaceae bacterium]|nr:hypothetical protein [Chlorobiaceae bacterium]